MRKELLNGTPIPYHLSIDALKTLMASADMKDFSLACEALSYHQDPQAYAIMKSHLDDKDKYRRLYVLKTIFRHAQAKELTPSLEAAIACDDFLFVSNGLLTAADYNIAVSETLLFLAANCHLPKLDMELCALKLTATTEDNYQKLTGLFEKSITSSQKEILCEILMQKYLPTKARDLFDIFSKDEFPKARLCAVHIGKAYGFDIALFAADADGHVRKAAQEK